ncbi:MAG: RIP metalloprotease RseP [Bacteroidetes bacterium]|nr:MAG: RIP metalloprotease RseP [Bacteroidota bacterium]
MEILSMVAQFILCITIIVGLHELGHLATAKWFGMRVEKYYIGFPPKIFSFKRGETEYGIGLIPLGGFVKIAGMVDESMDTEALKQEPQPYEFRSKPAWQRLIVMLGGIIVNVVTGVIAFICLLYFGGESYITTAEVNKTGFVAYPLAEKIGLRTGDRLVDVNGKKVEKFNDVLSSSVLLGSDCYYTIDREGKQIKINLPNDLVTQLSESGGRKPFIEPFMLFLVGDVQVGSPASKAGLQKGDKIVNFNGVPVAYFHELKKEQDKNKGKTVDMIVERAGKEVKLTVTSRADGTLGFALQDKRNFVVNYPSFGESIARGTNNAFGSIWTNIQGFGKIFRREVPVDSVSGPLGMYQIFRSSWDWYHFWFITALLSMWLAFINLLPIPALDGGHAMFLSLEMISGRKIPEKILERAQVVGMVLLLTLMVLILGLDIFKIAKNLISYFS